MRVVAFDTAAPVIGVGASDGDRVRVATAVLDRGSETWLVPTLASLCAELGFRLADVEGVVVTIGPGAFTGLRVGLAAALGVAVAAKAPVAPVSSLVCRARAAGSGPVLAMLDARKDRVYAQWFGRGRDEDPGDWPPDVAIGAPGGPFVATGEGAVRYRHRVEAAGGVLSGHATHPAVDALLREGLEALARGEGVDATCVRPLYLRDADARLPGT
jgi:tRNA threonylcarbamoyladenosine biosynthesis protein TsaB